MHRLLIAFLFVAQIKDVKGSSDHPLIGRFEGSAATAYFQKDFEEAKFLTITAAPIAAEGKLTQIVYSGPAKRSSIEIFRNFQQRLAANGFAPLYNCEKEACGSANQLVRKSFDETSVGRIGFGAGFRENIRFGTFRMLKGGIDVLAALYVGEYPNQGEPPLTMIRVLEHKDMETGKILVPTAQEMAQSFAREGKIALYGIYFDTGQAVVKPESKPTLDQVAEALRTNPKLNLLVVGHTDNVGEYGANVALSQRRAAAVVEQLGKQFAGRLQAVGVGMAAPVASNGDEAGRAKNRRVELVAR